MISKSILSRTRRRPILALRAAAVLFGAAAAPAWTNADVLELKGGGQIRGVLIEKNDAGQHVVRTPDGATVTVERRDIARYVEEDPNLAVYRERAQQTPDTANAHLELARWCDERKLFERRDHHYRRVLQLDPEDEEARLELGYEKYGTKWMTRKEVLESRGLKMYDGKYRTAQSIALRQRIDNIERTETEWFNQMRTWRGWMNSAREERVAEGRAQFVAVDDPSAAPALIRLLERERVPWIYDELLATLGELNHPATAQAMVDIALYSDDADTAHRALDYLMRLNVPRSIVPFVGALGHKDNIIVNRAAEALGVLGDVEAVSPLIDALQTKHKFQVNTGSKTNATFSNNGGGGFTQGGGPKIIERLLNNVEVLQALSKLTGGIDFDYDERAWRNWYVNERSKNQIDARRDY